MVRNHAGSRLKRDAPDLARQTYRLPPSVALTVRSDLSEKERFAFLKPLVRLAFTDFVASAALDKGSVSASTSRIAPQRDWLVEQAYDASTKGGSAFTLALSRLWLRDVVDWVPVCDDSGKAVSFDARGNIGVGTEQKVVFTGTAPLHGLRIPRTTATVTATYDRARVSDPVTHMRRQISKQKTFVVSASLQQDLPRQHLTWGLSLNGPWRNTSYRFDTVDHERAGTELNLFADYHPRTNVSLRLDIKDMLRRGYGRVVETYSGLRTPDKLRFADDRKLMSGPSAMITARRQF